MVSQTTTDVITGSAEGEIYDNSMREQWEKGRQDVQRMSSRAWSYVVIVAFAAWFVAKKYLNGLCISSTFFNSCSLRALGRFLAI